MLTIDSATADNHESSLGTVTSDLENDTGACTILYCGQAKCSNSIDTCNIYCQH